MLEQVGGPSDLIDGASIQPLKRARYMRGEQPWCLQMGIIPSDQPCWLPWMSKSFFFFFLQMGNWL